MKARTHVALLVLPTLHLLLCIATRTGLLGSEGSWGWFLVFLLDFPASILLLPLDKVADPLVVFGVFGTLWWFAISYVVIGTVRRISADRRSD